MSDQSALGDRVRDSGDASIYTIESARHGPAGSLPLEPSDLLERPSGDLFGWSLNVGMGWQPDALRRPEVLILSTQGGIREPDGTPLALGYHTGHWEVGLLMRAAAEESRGLGLAAVRRLRHRPVRRPHAGHHRHDGLAAVPQRRRPSCSAA